MNLNHDIEKANSDSLLEVIKVCSNIEWVRAEVLQNHDDNKWWPLKVTDWRLRLVFAGWCTRISYRMIEKYQDIVSKANNLGFNKLIQLSDSEINKLVSPIGLTKNRVEYLRSVELFLSREGWDLEFVLNTNNDFLINIFKERVKGAGYKVAQCAILYVKGYQCGIFPVDSGMKDLLGPCLGLNLPNSPISHDIMRKKMERLIYLNSEKIRNLAIDSGYGSLNLSSSVPPTWWVHLVLIYYKRKFCNARIPDNCPLRFNPFLSGKIGSMCNRSNSENGSVLFE